MHLRDHICIFILVAIHTYFEEDAHLSTIVYTCYRENNPNQTLKYNCIHIFTEEMTLIKYYCNHYHILLRIEENKTYLISEMHESHSNLITSHFR